MEEQEGEEQHRCELADSDFSHCGGLVEYTIDPFAAEIYEEIVWRWLCERHYEELADDI